MDGNRRWAKEHGLPVLEGHRRVVDVVLEPLIEHAADCGISYLTLWAWSTENWKRDSKEVKGIMNLLRYGFKTFGERMHKKGICIRIIGNISDFDSDIQDLLRFYVEKTKLNTKITVLFALNYGGRDEIIRAIHKSKGRDVTSENFSEFLDTSGIPDPDAIVRTGGEQRLSGFLLWQCQYAELFFTHWHMPDFDAKKLDEILLEYETRQRRFGA